MRVWLFVLLCVACGDNRVPLVPDGAPPDAPPVDAPEFPACREFRTVGMTPPVHTTGTLAGADITSPAMCAAVDAPYGILSPGPDSVVKLDGLVPGATYVVKVTSGSDLAFYVVTGCTTPTGPSAMDCLLFQDATSAHAEVGRFVATETFAYVVVDYWQSHAPNDPTFTLDAYLETCTSNAQCGGGTPVCDDGQCVQCASSFDCTDPAAPRCDRSTDTCTPGIDQCLSDDPGEPGNDGPAGATVLVPDGSGDAAASGQICSSPASEADYFAFDVTTLGEVWDISLAWAGTRDLDLELLDGAGHALGLSFWEHPEHVRLTYLPLGRYYVRVTEFAQSPDPSPVSYSVTAHRATGPGCTSSADCAAEFTNQIYRGTCSGGACVDIVGGGAVAEGGACDSQSDCAAGLSCPSFYFVANADTRDVCARGCSADTECPAGDVCTTYLQDNFCVQKCTDDLQCPTSLNDAPASGPWARLSCDVASGRCLP